MIHVEKNELKGIFNPIMRRFFCDLKKVNRCRFVGTFGLGERINGTFTGAKKLILDRKMDMYSRPENLVAPKKDEFFLEMTSPVNSEK